MWKIFYKLPAVDETPGFVVLLFAGICGVDDGKSVAAVEGSAVEGSSVAADAKNKINMNFKTVYINQNNKYAIYLYYNMNNDIWITNTLIWNIHREISFIL